jgi:dTDP-4-amino-4,6-dideoxygalactose transaminase
MSGRDIDDLYSRFYWREQNIPAPVAGPYVVYRGSGRAALLEGLRILGLTEDDTLLVPEYICAELTECLAAHGVSVRYYRMRPDLTADLEDVIALLDEGTKALLAVHYFGFPNRLEGLHALCRERNIHFIEDNAHGFLSADGERLLGTQGDLAIVSIHKTVLVRRLAALLVNAPELRDRARTDIPESRGLLEWYALPLLAFLWLGTRSTTAVKTLRRMGSRMKRAWSRSVPGVGRDTAIGEVPWRVAAHTWFQFRRIDLSYVRAKRRANYLRLVDWLRDGEGCTILKPALEQGVCPLFLPILVEDGAQLIDSLNAAGIEAGYWPNLPEAVVRGPERYAVANHLRRHLVTLPIAQDLTVPRRGGRLLPVESLGERIRRAYSSKDRPSARAR